MPVNAGSITSSAAIFEVTPDCDAVMFVVPAATPLASPLASIVAVAGTVEFQVAVLVKSCVVPSEKSPVAVNCFFHYWTMLI